VAGRHRADGSLVDGRLIAGGLDEAIVQPEWSPDGMLYFVSDRSGWWNLYRYEHGVVHPLCPREAEFGGPHWVFGGSMYGFRSARKSSAPISRMASAGSAACRAQRLQLTPIDTPYQEIRELRVRATRSRCWAARRRIAAEMARIDLASGPARPCWRARSSSCRTWGIVRPAKHPLPSANGRSAHAFYYPPANGLRAAAGRAAAADGDRPRRPDRHGGQHLKLATQFWTSRGIAVLDVNYGGSTGFGRAYRDLLKDSGAWSTSRIAWPAPVPGRQGLVDRERLLIRGGSAGGLTTLCALAFHDVFKAGASYYGVSDLKGLDADSHKFESHYNEYLIAPKESADRVYARTLADQPHR
jgi:hypothetical protein